jgi:hypothetical protein
MQQDVIFKNIFNTDLIGGHSKAFAAAEDYPYFNAAHYFTLASAHTNARDYESLASKASLCFENPLRLQHLLALKNASFDDDIHIIEENGINVNNTSFSTEIVSKTNELEVAKEEVSIQPIEHVTTENDNEVDEMGNELEAFEENPKLNVQLKTAAEALVNKEIAENTELPIFEPLFARDYFASQGIKLSEAMLGNDKLGQQLKSFTSWLKSMKKLHPEKLVGNIVVNEQAIQQQAAQSNIEMEVLTEAMAEVYAQQGKIVRAQDIYKKLSLQNPLKSAYFAAKSEKLK